MRRRGGGGEGFGLGPRSEFGASHETRCCSIKITNIRFAFIQVAGRLGDSCLRYGEGVESVWVGLNK